MHLNLGALLQVAEHAKEVLGLRIAAWPEDKANSIFWNGEDQSTVAHATALGRR
jgi:hypothetical protein